MAWTTLAAIFAATALIIGAGMLAMALGVMTTGRCLRGSCGGPGAAEDGVASGCADCPNRKRREAEAAAARARL